MVRKLLILIGIKFLFYNVYSFRNPYYLDETYSHAIDTNAQDIYDSEAEFCRCSMTLWLSYCEWALQFLRRNENETYHNIYLNHSGFKWIEPPLKCFKISVVRRNVDSDTWFRSERRVARCYGRTSLIKDNDFYDKTKFNNDIVISVIQNSLIIFKYVNEVDREGVYILDWMQNIFPTPHPNSAIFNTDLFETPAPVVVYGDQAIAIIREQKHSSSLKHQNIIAEANNKQLMQLCILALQIKPTSTIKMNKFHYENQRLSGIPGMNLLTTIPIKFSENTTMIQYVHICNAYSKSLDEWSINLNYAIAKGLDPNSVILIEQGISGNYFVKSLIRNVYLSTLDMIDTYDEIQFNLRPLIQ